MTAMVSASPDAISALASKVLRDWGYSGYRFTGFEQHGIVTAGHVRHSDGSEFTVLADAWGNTREVPEGRDWNAIAVKWIQEMIAAH